MVFWRTSFTGHMPKSSTDGLYPPISPSTSCSSEFDRNRRSYRDRESHGRLLTQVYNHITMVRNRGARIQRARETEKQRDRQMTRGL